MMPSGNYVGENDVGVSQEGGMGICIMCSNNTVYV